ncbi:hypothetical protein KKF63_09735, partial [bacterium]|nr:hypothetical protein [bacterium]
SDTFQGAVEYNDTFYDQNNENELYNLVEDFDFSSEDFFTGTVGVSDSVLETLSEYSCSVTPDIVISMDMADTGMMAVSEECEQIWSDMNFCDSESIQQAREAIFEVDYGPPAK